MNNKREVWEWSEWTERQASQWKESMKLMSWIGGVSEEKERNEGAPRPSGSEIEEMKKNWKFDELTKWAGQHTKSNNESKFVFISWIQKTFNFDFVEEKIKIVL